MMALLTFLLGCFLTAALYRGAHEAWKEQFLEDLGPDPRRSRSGASIHD